MSIDYTTYIGPFLVCETHKEIEKVKYYGCSSGCRQSKSRNKVLSQDKFCSCCGSPISELYKEEKHNVINIHQFVEDADIVDVFVIVNGREVEMPETTYLLLSNQTKLEDRNLFIDHRQKTGVHFDKSLLNIDHEMASFSEMYKKEIDQLSKVMDSVKYDWGAITYTY